MATRGTRRKFWFGEVDISASADRIVNSETRLSRSSARSSNPHESLRQRYRIIYPRSWRNKAASESQHHRRERVADLTGLLKLNAQRKTFKKEHSISKISTAVSWPLSTL